LKLATIDYVILVLYFSFVIGIGWRLRKSVTSAGDFLTAGHKVPLWITSLAFLAANLGAQEVVGPCASGAKYGIITAHFYTGLARCPRCSFGQLRFDEKRALNALTFAIMTLSLPVSRCMRSAACSSLYWGGALTRP
jgi:SSS family solute:Na+ symporter